MSEREWVDPKTGTKVCVGDRWVDREPVYTDCPLRTIAVLGIESDGRVKICTESYTWGRRMVPAHASKVTPLSIIKKRRLVSREPEPDPNALKPCPFCGAVDGKLGGVDGGAVVQCWTCAAQGPLGTSGEAEARRLWNTRTVRP